MEAPVALFGSIHFIGAAYAVYLLITGKPIFMVRARPTSTRPILMENDWFRAAGGIYLFDMILFLFFPSLPFVIFRIISVASGAVWLVGLIKILSRPVL